MKFLIDQQLPRALSAFIRSRGHYAFHVRDLGMTHADDRAIWAEAHRLSGVIISKDEDFSLIVSKAAAPQVVWVRVGTAATPICFRGLMRRGTPSSWSLKQAHACWSCADG